MYKKGRKAQTTIQLYQEQLEMLKKLSAKTGIPRAVYIREGIDIVLEKHKKELSSKKKSTERR